MGYYSEVRAVIVFDTPENTEKYFGKLETEEYKELHPIEDFFIGSELVQCGLHIYIHLGSVKYYDEYEWVSALEKFIKIDSVKQPGFQFYEFIQIGEDFSDVRIEKSNYDIVKLNGATPDNTYFLYFK